MPKISRSKTVSEFPFPVDRALYVNKLIKNSKSKKPSGPYWYAHYWNNGAFRTFYIGKELPEECRPYLNGGHPPESNSYSFNVADLTKLLDEGQEIEIDFGALAEQCKARYKNISGALYLLYRDPVGREIIGSGSITR